MQLIRYCIYLVLGLSLGGCIQPYAPEVLTQPNNFLVVDGFINTRGVTSIRLMRTRNLQDDSKIPVESKAVLYIEQEGGGRFPLTETAVAGTYTSAPLQLATGRRVRLYIKTQAQREYASDYVAAKATPAIDAVTWRIGPDGVQLYANTHDDTGETRYYRWEYEETWKFTSAFQSMLQWTPTAITYRPENIFNCWDDENSTSIKLSNTLKLTKDVVADYPLTLLPATSPKLRFRYSILVKQYALTAAEYAYWEALGKNTENIGSLYDALPTQLTGNVHALADAAEPVLGFVGAQSVTQQRLYIDRTELPTDWRFETGYDCELAELPPPLAPPVNPLVFFRDGTFIPVEMINGKYMYGTADCIDCRKRGTNVKPAFWQD
ncbi:DUF4249 domain-containing protein [Hymenobacter metallicola]|uniref:DUF4249 domain-containing protein n=1 Tax=Hymenobacter metallicola TaxID=2563114 RepID=A0A4Z0Q054_9BACT|nr:DUF4249 domain-containing protein [Hymenobacter metallicola]TGE22866.1 DUF4249 domain-containing protein [Hymenobacter metallicola]